MVALVECLWEHKSEEGDGDSFKDVTMRAAAEYIADKHTTGPIRVLKYCKTKWSGGGHPPFWLSSELILYEKLKATFQAIWTYRVSTSGSHWNNTQDTNIKGEVAVATFDNYLNVLKVCFTIIVLTNCLGHHNSILLINISFSCSNTGD